MRGAQSVWKDPFERAVATFLDVLDEELSAYHASACIENNDDFDGLGCTCHLSRLAHAKADLDALLLARAPWNKNKL